MSKKTLALIVGLILLTVVLLFVAINQGRTPSQPSTPDGSTTTPSPAAASAFTTLSMSPNPVVLSGTGQGQVEVLVNTDQNDVTAIQLEIAYDPALLTNVDITAGSFFPNPVVLLKDIDRQEGRITFAFAITPAQNPAKGEGVAAILTFQKQGGATGQTDIELLPKSLVTAQGLTTSVLKSATGTTVDLSSGNGVQAAPLQTSVTTAPPVSSPQPAQ